MAFPEVSARQPRWTIRDILVIVAICSLPSAAVSPPRAPEVAGLSALVLGVGALLWWLAARGGHVRVLGPIALPAIIVMTMVELVLSCIAFACDPGAAVLILGAQLSGLIYASFRW
jgi:hypothetical protein